MPASGPISFSQLQTEFGGTNPISINEYYTGGLYVPSKSGEFVNVPSNGIVSLNQFYGKFKRTATANFAVSASNPGVRRSGRGPRSSPGYISNTAGVRNGYYDYCPAARRWYSPAYTYGAETYAYSWNRALAFVHPYTNITAATTNSWGFDAGDVIRATDIIFVSVGMTVDDYAAYGYSKMNNGVASIASAFGAVRMGYFTDPAGERHAKSATVNYAIPDPGVNELIFVWQNDNLGTNSTTFNMKCTSYGTLA